MQTSSNILSGSYIHSENTPKETRALLDNIQKRAINLLNGDVAHFNFQKTPESTSPEIPLEIRQKQVQKTIEKEYSPRSGWKVSFIPGTMNGYVQQQDGNNKFPFVNGRMMDDAFDNAPYQINSQGDTIFLGKGQNYDISLLCGQKYASIDLSDHQDFKDVEDFSMISNEKITLCYVLTKNRKLYVYNPYKLTRKGQGFPHDSIPLPDNITSVYRCNLSLSSSRNTDGSQAISLDINDKTYIWKDNKTWEQIDEQRDISQGSDRLGRGSRTIVHEVPSHLSGSIGSTPISHNSITTNFTTPNDIGETIVLQGTDVAVNVPDIPQLDTDILATTNTPSETITPSAPQLSYENCLERIESSTRLSEKLTQEQANMIERDLGDILFMIYDQIDAPTYKALILLRRELLISDNLQSRIEGKNTIVRLLEMAQNDIEKLSAQDKQETLTMTRTFVEKYFGQIN